MNINFNEIEKILIIQYQPFGDVLLNTGYLPALRRRFPDAKIDFLVRKPYQAALENNPYLNELIVFQNGKGLNYLPERLRLISRIRSRRYNLIIDQIRNTGSAQITIGSGAKYRLGFVHQRWRSFYNIKAERKAIRYYSAMKFDTLAPLDIEEEPHKLFYFIKDSSYTYVKNWLAENNKPAKPLVCFSPGTPVLAKQWDLGHYARLADRIINETGHQVLLMWGPGEKDDAEKVSQMMQQKPLIAPTTDFNQAAAMLKQCTLLVCNDGGLNHLSVATETPSIAFFGKHKPKRWSPVIFKGHYHFFNAQADYRTDRTLGISVDEVFNKVQEITGS